MPISDDYRNVLAMLTQQYGHDLAFYFDDDVDEDGRFTVFFATTEQSWSCITLVLQHMAGRYKMSDGTSPRLCFGSAALREGAALGMCMFLGKEEAIWEQHLGYVMNNQRHRTLVTAWKIHLDDVTRRDGLFEFVNLQLNQSPGVRLDHQQSTHIHRIYMALAFRSVRNKFTSEDTRGLPIAAVLVDPENGNVRALARNTKKENETFHAEVNVVQAFLKRYPGERDKPLILYTTLQPCPMCASMIKEHLRFARVFYGQSDTGNHMQYMAPQPDFCRLLAPYFVYVDEDEMMMEDVPVKPLPGWTFVQNMNFGGGGWQKTQDNIPNHLNTVQTGLKKLGSKSQVNIYNSLTRNLYKDLPREAIYQAANMLDKKTGDYLNGAKSVNVPDDPQRTQRRRDIRSVLMHIYPLIQTL